ncbi:MAG: DUF3084 domain-containing protein, partial [Bacillota bacterium]
MYAFGLILLLILLSGLIAYLGDQIGMKLGKKRISLFGLRPKYSSIIITVITGMLIAGISIIILLTAYSGLRQALFNINEVLERLDELDNRLAERTLELEELQEQRDELRDELEDVRLEFDEAEANLEEAKADIADLEEEREQLRAERDELMAERDELIAERDQLRNERDELLSERDELDEMVEELRVQRDDLDEQLEELNTELTDVNKQLEDAREQVLYFMDEDIVYRRGEIIYSEVIEGGRSESEIIADLNEFLSQANQVAQEREVRVDEETGMALHLQTEDILHTAQMLYNVEQGERLIISLAARVNVPRSDTLRADIYINRNFVVFRKGDEISSAEMDADAGTDTIDGQLRELLSEVNQEASAKGMLQDLDGSVGSLDFMNFYQIVNEIQGYSGEVDVSVQAAEEIWRHDRLSDNLEFEINEIDDAEEAEDDDTEE